MPRYFFDTDDDHHQHRDEDGTELPDLDAAWKLALAVLPDMARDHRTADGDRRNYIVDVRIEDRRVIYTACMSLLARQFK